MKPPPAKINRCNLCNTFRPPERIMIMKAALLHRRKPIEENPLSIEEVSVPDVGRRQVLIRVAACGVCRSNLHMIEGEWVAMGVPAWSCDVPELSRAIRGLRTPSSQLPNKPSLRYALVQSAAWELLCRSF